MTVRLPDRNPGPDDYAVLRMVHEAYVKAVDTLREQAQHEIATQLGLPVERIKNMWWAAGCT